jgi:alanyl-tRNA synthetase
VRRIEAVTGPAAAQLLRDHDRLLAEVAGVLRTRPEDAPQALRRREEEWREKERAAKSGAGAPTALQTIDLEPLLAAAANVDGVPVLATTVQAPDAAVLLQIVDRLRGKLGDAAIVLGTAVEDRVHLVVSLAPALVERGLKAGAVVKTAAKIVGGGGGGRDTLAQAGGRHPEKLGEAIEAAESEIFSALED